jgi:hypothetical protein
MTKVKTLKASASDNTIVKKSVDTPIIAASVASIESCSSAPLVLALLISLLKGSIGQLI